MSLYEVEGIIDKRFNLITKQIQYKVKWIGYDQQQSTWEPISNLKNIQQMIQHFEDHYGNLSDDISNQNVIKDKMKAGLINSNKSNIRENAEQVSSIEDANIQLSKEQRSEKPQKHKKTLKQIENKFLDKQSQQSQKSFNKRGRPNKLYNQSAIIEKQVVNIHPNSAQQSKVEKIQNPGNVEQLSNMKQINNFFVLEMARNGVNCIFLVSNNGEMKWMTKKDLVRSNICSLIEFYERHLHIYDSEKVEME